MKGRVLKFPARNVRRGSVWCEPLNVYFPQVGRRVMKDAALSPAAPNRKPKKSTGGCAFALFDADEGSTARKNVIPIRSLSSTDDASLVVRHHWSASIASAYLQGVEDIDPRRACAGVYETEQAIFTIAQCQTRDNWPSPMIFYLADLFDDASELGAQLWERSVCVDGKLQETDFFCGDI